MSTPIKVSYIKNPTKIIEFKGIKIHLEGVDGDTEGYIEGIKLPVYNSLEERQRAGAVYVSRIIRHSIKKVENLVLVDEEGNEAEFNVQFTDYTNTEMSIESYTILMRALKSAFKQDSESFQGDVIGYYNDITGNNQVDGVEVKKKVTKKKATTKKTK